MSIHRIYLCINYLYVSIYHIYRFIYRLTISFYLSIDLSFFLSFLSINHIYHIYPFSIHLSIYQSYFLSIIFIHVSKIYTYQSMNLFLLGLLIKKQDLCEIINLCHNYGIPVCIDEAHGAHLRFLSEINEDYTGM